MVYSRRTFLKPRNYVYTTLVCAVPPPKLGEGTAEKWGGQRETFNLLLAPVNKGKIKLQ